MFGFLRVLVAGCCVGRVTRLHRDANYHYDEQSKVHTSTTSKQEVFGSAEMRFKCFDLFITKSISPKYCCSGQ